MLIYLSIFVKPQKEKNVSVHGEMVEKFLVPHSIEYNAAV